MFVLGDKYIDKQIFKNKTISDAVLVDTIHIVQIDLM